jgi:hypothetical protein
MHAAVATTTLPPLSFLAPLTEWTAPDEPRCADEPPRGCGWFDSSLELSRGLAVVEHAGFDALAAEAPLAWQLAAWL